MGKEARAGITLEMLYKVGLHVFAGWHEMMALRSLHKKNPMATVPFKFMQNCNIYIFPFPPTEEILQQVRVCGAVQNQVEETLQIHTWADTLLKMRNAFEKYGSPSSKPDMYGTMDVKHKVLYFSSMNLHRCLLFFTHFFFLCVVVEHNGIAR